MHCRKKLNYKEYVAGVQHNVFPSLSVEVWYHPNIRTELLTTYRVPHLLLL